jgi:hypothetical protein
MNMRFSVIFGLLGVLGAGSATAAVVGCPAAPAQPVLARTNTDTGHYFEVYKADAISWDCANADANGRSYQGVPGHLATITSSGEDKFVDQLRQDSLTAPSPLGQRQVWVGGFQEPSSSEPGGGWKWVKSEGPFPGANTGPAYTGWAQGEPNNSGGVESNLTLGRFGLGGGWNDEGAAVGSIGGYIVEYDLPRPAACVGGSSCQTIQGQTLIFPPESFGPGATITFNAYEFTDPRVAAGKCGIDALTLFGAGYNTPELRIPPYLCGSPKFIVVAVDGSQLTFNKGVVQVENFTDQVPSLNGNQNKVCNDPIPAGVDPQFQDVVVYQTTDPNRMRESGQVNIDPQFVGAAGEFTNSCGSSRAAVQESSYFVVGMHIDFGAGYTLGGNAAGNYGRFVALTRYKLTVLQQSVVAANAAGALNNSVTGKMNLLLNSAVTKLGSGDPSGALEVVNKFLSFVGSATYAPVNPIYNYNGEHLMRGRNVAFMLRVKVKPYAP